MIYLNMKRVRVIDRAINEFKKSYNLSKDE